MITLKHGMLLVVALLGLPLSQLDACSIAVVCTHNGFEAAKKFTVTISHAGKPLKGVLIEVIPDDGVNISKITETVGVVQFDDLLPGKYHISVSMLGISSVYECFHVSKWTTGLNAKHSLTYSWGDDGIETRQIAGKLVSRVLSANGQNPKTVSIAEIHLTLTDPVTGVQYETTSSPEGVFLFSGIAEEHMSCIRMATRGFAIIPATYLFTWNAQLRERSSCFNSEVEAGIAGPHWNC